MRCLTGINILTIALLIDIILTMKTIKSFRFFVFRSSVLCVLRRNDMAFSEEDKILIKHYRLEKGYRAGRLLWEFPDRTWTKGGLNKLLAKIDLTGSIERKKGSGRFKSARVPQNIAVVEALAASQEDEGDEGTHRTPRQIEFQTGISRSSVRRIIHDDLEMKTYGRTFAKKLNEREKTLRVKRGKRLLRRLTREKLGRTFFSDETNFHVGQYRNKQNDKFYSTSKKKRDIPEKRLLRETVAFPQKVMVSAGVSKLGKTSIIFCESGMKMNQHVYKTFMEEKLIPEMKKMGGRRGYIFQQDGATSHTAKMVVNFLKTAVPDFIQPSYWPPSSPDLNPLDYCLWSILKKDVYCVKIKSMDHLKQRIQKCWKDLPQETVNRTIDRFRKRVSKMIAMKGNRFEHLL